MTRCLPPLPDSRTERCVEIQIVDVEADRFGNPGSGAVQKLQQGARTQPCRRLRLHR